MPVLDIATAQASLQNHLSPLRAQPLIPCKVLPSPFIFGDEKRPLARWKSFHFPKTLNTCERSKLQIKAVATLEPKALHKEEEKSKESVLLDDNSNAPAVQADSSDADSLELDENEKLRRMRISKANKGNTPWNKGRKHSPETIQRIRERTRLAMQNPKIRMKLANLGHAQSKETRTKIGVGVRMRWKKRREKKNVQETCLFEWQNLIAEASRRGYAGEEEMQWDSYKILTEKLEVEWVESIEQRKTMPRPKGSKRAPKSPEQRRKIAEAIAAKWADPEYRERVCSALSKYHGTPVGIKPRRRTQPKKQDPAMKKSDTENLSKSDTAGPMRRPRLRRSKTPVYKDPLARSKLEMIKKIREQRAAAGTKKTEAIERARLLIAEAQKAAKALEVAATTSPIAQASLIEARKLIAEAILSIESVDAEYMTSSKDDIDPSLSPIELAGLIDEEADVNNGNSSQAELKEVNGTKIVASSEDKDLNFTNLSLHDILNGEYELLSTRSNGFNFPSINLESIIEHSSSPKPNGSHKSEKSPLPNGSKVQHLKEELPSKPITSAKKWVCGRLVEVTDED
ncbi:stress response protein NST1 [Ricinus communis]|uniref:stress response protein NST1 n=1 Tax=Ricinus communis TaxID=3988 RepID=UPI0007726859|nr:stress response protein NST1 [Ricinus communis]|eukprot:XP_002533812.2 stress response protein NST1 [Ricinus communis]